MSQETLRTTDPTEKESPPEALATVNARLRRKRIPAQNLMEAEIEAKTKQRRKSEKPATAGWKSS